MAGLRANLTLGKEVDWKNSETQLGIHELLRLVDPEAQGFSRIKH